MILKDLKILIVENEPFLYRGLQNFLRENGYKVIENANDKIVDNYYDAIKLLKNHKPNIAILDIALKGEKSGLDIAEYIRKRYNTFIIMLTGHITPENKRRANLIKTDRFFEKIDKPYSERQVLTAIETAESQIIQLAQNESLGIEMYMREIKIVYDPEKKRENNFR